MQEVTAIIWNDDLTSGEIHLDTCSRVASQRAILTPAVRRDVETRKELSLLLSDRDPCDCGES